MDTAEYSEHEDSTKIRLVLSELHVLWCPLKLIES